MQFALPFSGRTAAARRGRLLLATLLTLALTAVVGWGPALGDVTTISHDASRIAWDPNEPGLGPDSVISSDFGRQFSTKVDGSVYAQPLAVGGTLVVATENDKAYGLDSANGSVRWQRDLGAPWPASAINCHDLAPNIGITSTPVYDEATASVYLTTKVNNGRDVQHPHWYMHAIDPATGNERSGWPVTIAGAPSNDPGTKFNPMTQLQRAGLLILDGVVYAGFASQCDHGNYRGYVVGVSTTNAKVASMWATEVGGSNTKAGVWQSGGGLVSDRGGRAFFSTGNGVAPPAGPGTRPPGTLSESVVRLDAAPGRPLKTADFFSPANAPTLDANDIDLGSGGPIALPDSFGTATNPHVLVQQGKDGRIFLLDRDHLGGRSQGPGGKDAALGVVGPYQGQWGHPAAWTSDAGGFAYFVGNGGPLRAFRSGARNGRPALTQTGTSSDSFPYTSGSPVITSDGARAQSGVVWVIWSNGSTGGHAQLRAYSAIPDSAGRLSLLYSAPIGTASKFAVPATDANHVFVGTRDGHVLGFGRPATSVLTGSPVDLGNVGVGTTTSKTLTLTATSTVTLNTVTTNDPFSVTPPKLPLTMEAGEQLDLPVSFTPSGPGAATDLLSIGTDSGTVGFSLHGVGTKPGLNAAPAAATFTDQPVGTSATVNVQITNTGIDPETITSVVGASAPFSVSGLPANGSTVAPGDSFVLSVAYHPTAASASDKSSVVIGSTSGRLTVPITGNAVVGQGHLVFTPPTLDFGSLATGTSRTLSFDITNTGNRPVTITRAKAPNGDFSSGTPLPEGMVIGPDQVVHQAVTYTPSTVGQGATTYDVNGDSGQGAMTENLIGVGTGTVPTPDTTEWSANSSASISAGSIRLTPAVTYRAGSAFYRQAIRTEGLHATFSARIHGGTGADGLTFALLDPTTGKPTSVGAIGGGLGFSGLHGVAVALNTHRNVQANSSNFVGVTAGGSGRTLRYLATRPVPTSLRSGTHAVDVQVTGGHIKVSVDGTALLDVVPPAGALPPNAIAGFTGATGARTDIHLVSNTEITTTAGTGAQLTADPLSVDFGNALEGSTSTMNMTLSNRSTQPETVTAVVAPGGPYTVTPPTVGSTVPAGGAITVPVTFAPAADGTFTQSLKVTTTSGSVVVPINGTGSNRLPDLTTSNWTYSGLTTLSGNTVTLTTDGQRNGAGLIVNGVKVSPLGLHATFTAQIGGSHATGADGLTFALLDAAAPKPTAPGVAGQGLGIAGLPAVFAGLDTADNTGVSGRNYAGVGTATAGSTTVSYLKTTTAIPALRSGTHLVDVSVTMASHMVVKIDGTQVLDVAVTLPPQVLVAFTGAVGGISDTHAVINPVVTYQGT